MRRAGLLAALALAACGSDKGGGIPYDTLSEYGLFVGDGATQEPVPGVVAYDVIAPLFADYATKYRFLRIPEGTTITYTDTGRWMFPVGTYLIKTFAYPDRLLETRLIIKGDDGQWTPHTYVWNEEQTEATREIAGARVASAWVDDMGMSHPIDYRVPNTNQCLGCHGDRGVTDVLGPRTRQLNMDHDYGAGPENQIDHIAGLGWFDVTPPAVADRPTLVDPFGAATVEERGRSYLEANCAHCHNPEAAAQSTGLRLNLETTEPIDLGVCRSPFSAGDGTGGRQYDVVPGHPELSIMIFRVSSTEPEIKMPEMPTQLSDSAGVALLSQWITGLTPEGCP